MASAKNGIHRSSSLQRRYVSDYLADDEYRELQKALAANPELGAVMPGTGGFRKVRWRDPRRGKGRRGCLRVIYYYFPTDRQIWLMTFYSKDEAPDLTLEQKRALTSAIQAELRAREAAKPGRRGGKSRRKQS